MNIFQKIKQLDLPKDSFVVVGSGPLAALGLRQANDIDLLVAPEVYQKLKAAGWKEQVYPSTLDTGLTHDVFEIVSNWHGKTVEDLAATAVWFEGIAFAHLEDVKSWKTKLARKKDLQDLNLIKAHQDAVLAKQK